MTESAKSMGKYKIKRWTAHFLISGLPLIGQIMLLKNLVRIYKNYQENYKYLFQGKLKYWQRIFPGVHILFSISTWVYLVKLPISILATRATLKSFSGLFLLRGKTTFSLVLPIISSYPMGSKISPFVLFPVNRLYISFWTRKWYWKLKQVYKVWHCTILFFVLTYRMP